MNFSIKKMREVEEVKLRNPEEDPGNKSETTKQNEMPAANTTSIWSSICHFLIILSVFLVIFAAFRNTLTWWVDFGPSRAHHWKKLQSRPFVKTPQKQILIHADLELEIYLFLFASMIRCSHAILVHLLLCWWIEV